MISDNPLAMALKDFFHEYSAAVDAARSTLVKQPALQITGVRSALAQDGVLGPVLKSGAHPPGAGFTLFG